MPVDPANPRETEPSSMTMQGLTLSVPPGWEARIQQSTVQEEGAERFPVMHAATVPLPSDRADYGAGVVERLGGSDVFVSLVEFGEEAVDSNLYPRLDRMPHLEPSMFHPFQLQRRLPGQAGVQVFFTMEKRAFCLYVVIGSFARRIELAARANEIVSALSIAPRS